MRRSSEQTKALILSAARERFAADGYERGTIRAIAGDAGIDPSMVMRYFGNKEGLFAAAAEFDLRLPDLAGVPTADVGRHLVTHFLNRWEGDETLMALLRSAVTNAAAADRLRAIFAEQVGPAVRIFADPAEAPHRAGLAASQILGLALTRYVLRFPPLVSMTPQEIIDWLSPTIQRYLTGQVGSTPSGCR